ncbi:MAG: pyridoxal phosphate-dependent aminotransferase [Vicinamibacteria bacterium]|nr:pyridoxal phosphate-dependent aminotransferase [Vicinamibacteria bacterium]
MRGPSQRLHAVQTPIIPLVGEWIRQTPGTISLGQGVVSYGPPAEALDAIPAFLADAENHKYKPVDGIPELQEALAVKLAVENGVIVGEERRLVVTAGGNMAFMNAVLAVTDPDDEVILLRPFYFNHEMAVVMAGARPVIVDTDDECQPRPELIRAAITSRTRAVVTISPNNPAGVVYSESLLREINSLCGERGIYHVHDEAYEHFLFEGARHYSPGAFEDASAHTISLYSLSKSYGFASWRIGYMVLPERLLESVKKIQDTYLICPPVVSQHVALGALRVGSDHCLCRLPDLAARRMQVARALSGLGSLCRAPRALGAFYFLVTVRTALDSVTLGERLVREHRVAVMPGKAFGMERPCTLRVSYGALDDAIVAEATERLVRGLRALAEEHPR